MQVSCLALAHLYGFATRPKLHPTFSCHSLRRTFRRAAMRRGASPAASHNSHMLVHPFSVNVVDLSYALVSKEPFQNPRTVPDNPPVLERFLGSGHEHNRIVLVTGQRDGLPLFATITNASSRETLIYMLCVVTEPTGPSHTQPHTRGVPVPRTGQLGSPMCATCAAMRYSLASGKSPLHSKKPCHGHTQPHTCTHSLCRHRSRAHHFLNLTLPESWHAYANSRFTTKKHTRTQDRTAPCEKTPSAHDFTPRLHSFTAHSTPCGEFGSYTQPIVWFTHTTHSLVHTHNP